MSAKSPNVVDERAAGSTSSASKTPGITDDMQARCNSMESGLNDFRNVLRTLSTTCAILEKSAEKLGSDMREIRKILASHRSPSTSANEVNISAGLWKGKEREEERVNDVSMALKQNSAHPGPSSLPADTSNALAGPSGTRTATRISPSTSRPQGAYITPVGRLSVPSLVSTSEASLPLASSSSQPDTPARIPLPTRLDRRALPAGAAGIAPAKCEKDKYDLMKRRVLPQSSPLHTLPPRRARKHGLGVTRLVPTLQQSSSNIEEPPTTLHAQKDEAAPSSASAMKRTKNNTAPEATRSAPKPPKQVHFDSADSGAVNTPVPAPNSEIQTPADKVEATDAESPPVPAPQLGLRIRIRNPTKTTPGRIENVSSMTVRVPKVILDKMSSSMALSAPPGLLASSSLPSASVASSGLASNTTVAQVSLPSAAAEPTGSKAKKPRGPPRKRQKTVPGTSSSKEVKKEQIETSLADAAPSRPNVAILDTSEDILMALLLGHDPWPLIDPPPQDPKPDLQVNSLSSAMETCSDAFSNYMAVAPQDSRTSTLVAGTSAAAEHAPAQPQVAATKSSVPSTESFSPRIHVQDLPPYPGTSSQAQASSSNAVSRPPADAASESTAPAPISPPFLVPSNAPPLKEESLSPYKGTSTTRPRRQRGSRIAELDKEAEERMRVSRDKRDKTRWDPRSGQRVVVPADGDAGQTAPPVKRPRGRPKGSLNKKTVAAINAAGLAGKRKRVAGSVSPGRPEVVGSSTPSGIASSSRTAAAVKQEEVEDDWLYC